MTQGEIIKVLCPECGRETNHAILAEHSESNDPETDYQWNVSHEIVQCRGCDTVSFRTESSTEDDWDPNTGKVDALIRLYPPRVPDVDVLNAKDLFESVPVTVKQLYLETHQALLSESPTLAVAGIRAVVEAVCVEKKMKGRDLETKIKGLVTAGALTQGQADGLDILRLLGNDAVHAALSPPPQELRVAFGIVTQLLRTSYVDPNRTSALREGRLNRRK